MKKLKKFAALLLVGVMALALLTACGGGGSGENAQAEASVMAAINDGRATPLKNNDSAMLSIADKTLDAYLYGERDKYGFKNNVHMKVEDGKLTCTVVVKYDYNNTKLQDVIDSITNNYPDSNVDFKQSSKWTRVGVVAKTKSGQTYVAVSVQVGKLA